MTTNYSLFRMLSPFFLGPYIRTTLSNLTYAIRLYLILFFLKGEISTEVTVSNSKSSSIFNNRGQFKKNNTILSI